ncbi:hypothetical protein GAYE_SCF00G1683 [Galdieria yellowstonensis]|uniref:CBM20 domain-containing protein n=1 Tax=Galdieria yellowstonensis TaxID=3028027 RepID=A0AAV9I8Y1_9RHOD|nr:hypothetical protein GAYE_SCF00G1683 [Galdieria yellowstonensis]
MEQSSKTTVKFHVRCETQRGERLALVGDLEALGAWDPARAIPLWTNSKKYPRWSCSVTLPCNTWINYKYCIVDYGDDFDVATNSGADSLEDGQKEAQFFSEDPHPPRFVRWENFEANRRLKTSGVFMRVDDRKFDELFNEMNEARIRVDYGHVFSRLEAPSSSQSSSSSSPSSGGLPSKLLIVLYRLPVIAKRTSNGWSFKWDDDALYLTSVGLRDGLQGKIRFYWIGILNCEDDVPEDEQEGVTQALMDRFNCIPVFVPKVTLTKFYQGFCKGVLWPLFHMIIQVTDDGGHTKQFDRSLWHVYCLVNRKFADVVVGVYHESDLIWIHDYHLMVLPSQLRRKLSGAKIGFYLHIPWPSSEIYRSLPVRDELLRGLLSASLLGFHLFDYARHFLSACTRLLNLEHESRRGSLGVEYGGRHVMIRVSHIGIDPKRFQEYQKKPEVVSKTEELKQKFKDKIVLGAIDDLDIVKGISLKLMALDFLLANYSSYRNRIVLNQVAIPKAARVKENVRNEIRSLVNQINERYGNQNYQPVMYFEREISFDERVAMYSRADAFFLTPIRDGLNLVPYEYIVSASEGKGQLILSEFTGCSRALSGAVRVNPWNVEEVASVIDRVMQLDQNEISRKLQADYKYVTAHSTMEWAESFLADLERASEPINRVTKLGLGFGVGFRLLEFEGFRHLSTDMVLHKFQKSQRRLLLLDYDGTLTRSGNHANRMAHAWATPTSAVMNNLAELSQDTRNIVFIMSGRRKEVLEQTFEQHPRIALSAEHGFHYRWNRDQPWQVMYPDADLSWLEVAHEIMVSYTERTDGSYIEEKTAGLVWHFVDADPEFGSWQAKEMHDHLESVLSAFGVQVITGNGWVQVRLKDVNKGAMVKRILDELSSNTPDFVFCCGDDRTDEDMFAFLETTFEASEHHDGIFTCTVGAKPSNARYYLRDNDEVADLLAVLATTRNRAGAARSYTVNDFHLSEEEKSISFERSV